MDGQSNLQSEVVLVPPSVQFDCQREKHCEVLVLFASLVFVRFWHEAPLGRKARLNDMQFLESLTSYPNRTTAKAAIARDTFSRHLWYFSETLAGLSFLTTELGQM